MFPTMRSLINAVSTIMLVETFDEIAPETYSDGEMYVRGEAAGRSGNVDWKYLARATASGFKEDYYWRAHNYEKKNAPKALNNLTKNSKMIASKVMKVIPPSLTKAISAKVAIEIAKTFMQGHSADRVNTIEARDEEDTFDAMVEGFKIAAKYNNNGFVLYRSITLSGNGVQALSRPCRLGCYWTLDETMTIGAHGMDHEGGDHYVTVTAEAPLSSVNWAKTIVKLVDGAEMEVVLNENAPVTLLAVSGNNSLTNYEKGYTA